MFEIAGGILLAIVLIAALRLLWALLRVVGVVIDHNFDKVFDRIYRFWFQ